MGMTMQLIQRQKQEQRLEQRLTQEQRILLRTHLFSLRMELVNILREERYVPKAECPKCLRQLTPIEIICGFNRDPNDYTTCCSACGHRFEPKLICFYDGGQMELPFFCDSQALSQLHGKENISPDELARKHPAIYRSAIVHHGTITGAFRKIGIEYRFEEVSDWKNKIKPFLSSMPDTAIAECVGVSVSTVSAMRKKLGKPRYKVSNALLTASLSSVGDRYYVLAKGVYNKSKRKR